MVQELAKATRNYNPKSEQIEYLKLIATRMGQRKVLRALENPSNDLCEPATDNVTRLIEAIEAGDYTKSLSLINSQTVNGKDKYGWPAVFTAFSTFNISASILASAFLQKGVNVNILGPFDVNLLMIATNNNFLNHVMSLSTEPDIDLEHEDKFGVSALELAETLGHTQCKAVIERAISMAPKLNGCTLM
jgi:hypothetical protein